MNNNLTPLLSKISKLTIDAFQIDTKNDSIKLNFDISKSQNQISEIIFNEVTSFYYLDHNQDMLKDNEYTHLNTIMYCGGSMPDFVEFSEEDEMAISIPNFIIELNDSNMFIEANSIVIDQKKYLV